MGVLSEARNLITTPTPTWFTTTQFSQYVYFCVSEMIGLVVDDAISCPTHFRGPKQRDLC